MNTSKAVSTTSQVPMQSNSNTYFLRHGANFFIKDHLDDVPPIHKLPGGNFAIKYAREAGYFLEKIPDFPEHKRVYGDAGRNAARVFNSFKNKQGNLGVTLYGEKGAGKTLLGRLISQLAANQDIPTLFITSDFSGEDFFQFLYKIEQECVIFIDEYEKLYEPKKQEEMLTVLDGVFQSKKLFILTCNDRYKLDSHLRNRPGRIHYAIEFNGISPEFIQEYCQDRLEDKSKISEVMSVCGLFSMVNFDMLQTLVWEMNTYKESAIDAIRLLNAKPDGDETTIYDVVGIPVFLNKEYTVGYFKGSPLTKTILTKSFYIPKEDMPKDIWDKFILDNYIGEPAEDQPSAYPCHISFNADSLCALDPIQGSYTFKDKPGNTLIFTRRKKVTITVEELYSKL